MLPKEARVVGIEDRHEFVGVGGVVVHEKAYRETGQIYVAIAKESKPRRNIVRIDKRRYKLLPPEPNAPKLPGQWGLFWETLKPNETNLATALQRAIGINNQSGEEVSGVSYDHPPEQIHLNTIMFASENGIIPAWQPGTENTVLANFVIFDNHPLRQVLGRGTGYDKNESIQWVELNLLLEPTIVSRDTFVRLSFPIIIPDSPSFPIDPRVKMEAEKYVSSIIGQRRMAHLGSAKKPLKEVIGEEDKINLGCINLRPGTLQTLEDLRDFLINPEKYQPRVHRKLLYCQEFGMYEKAA